MDLLSTLSGSLMEGFFPAGWDLKKIDACVDPDPANIGVRQKWWHKQFQLMPCGSLAGILAERHVSEIEQPDSLEIVAKAPQRFGEDLDGFARSLLLSVNTEAADGKQTGLDGVVGEAVLLFAKPQMTNGPQVEDHLLLSRAERLLHHEGHLIELAERFQRRQRIARLHLLLGQLRQFFPDQARFLLIPHGLLKNGGAFAIAKHVAHRILCLNDPLQTPGHLAHSR